MRYVMMLAPTGAVQDGEGDGVAISCADSSHNRGKLVLALIAIVGPKENEKVSQSVSFSNNLELRCVRTKYRHDIFKAAYGMDRRNILAF
jgi:hypothetical protein